MSDTKRIVRADLDEIVEAITSNISMTSGCEYCEHEVDVDDIRTALERFVVAASLCKCNKRNDFDFYLKCMECNGLIPAHTTPKKGGDDEG